MDPAPSFGKRGLKGPPVAGPPLGRPPSQPPPRRLRSHVVVVGAVGLFAIGVAGATGYQEYRCQPPEPGQPDKRPQWCFEHANGHSGGHGFGLFSGGGGGAHASFGGFGGHGAGHGGGE